MTEEEVKTSPIRIDDEVYITRHNFRPSILPEWKNLCGVEEVKEPTTVNLTEENAHEYAGVSSKVGWKGRVDYALDHIEKDSDLDASFLSFLLESVISTVILLTSSQKPPDNYLISTQLFLRYVRNEFGEQPPNIAAFLEYLQTRSSPEVLSALESLDDPDNKDLPKHLVITQVPKAVQQRICK